MCSVKSACVGVLSITDTHIHSRQIHCEIQGKCYFQTVQSEKNAKVSASNCTNSVTPLVKSDMDVYRGKDRQWMAQPQTATHTTVTNMTRRGKVI